MSVKVIEFPKQIAAQDVPSSLRSLADAIERGDYGDAHNVAWAIDCGHNRIEIGLAGQAPEPGPTAYLLFGLAKRKIENLGN